jgi:hypothetical protein
MSGAQRHFNSLKEWEMFGPDQGNEYFPKFTTPIQTYQQWLQDYPEGYVCQAND